MGYRATSLIPIIFLLFPVAIRAGDAELDRYAASAPDRDRFPDADALILKEVRTLTLDKTGKRTERLYRLVKLLTPQGQRGFADPRFAFDSARQTFRVLKARTRMRDGKVVDTPKNGVNIVTPRPLADTPAYATRREGVVSHIGTQMGALIEVEIEIADLTGARRGMDGVEIFGEAVPVLEKTLAIEVDPGVVLKVHAEGERFTAAPSKSARWTLKNIPPYPDEPHAPPRSELCHRVYYSTWPSWSRWGKSFYTRFGNPSAGGLPLELMKSLKGAKGKATTAEKIADLETALSKRVRFVPCSYEGEALKPALETWSRGYAGGVDLASLYCVSLYLLGLEGEPVWIAPSRAPLPGSVAVPSALGSLWIKVRAGEREWWIDPARSMRETGLLPPAGCPRFSPGVDEAPAVPGQGAPSQAFLEAAVKGTLRIGEDGSVEGRLLLELRGRLNPVLRSAGIRETVKGTITKIWEKVEPSKWIEIEASADRTLVALELKVAGAVKEDGGLAWFSLPESFFLPLLDPPRADRRLPYRFDMAMAEKVELHLRFPPSWKIAAMPSPLSGKVESAFRVGTMTWAKDGGLLLFRSLETTGRDVGLSPPPTREKDMNNFRDLLAAWKAEAGRTVMFETK